MTLLYEEETDNHTIMRELNLNNYNIFLAKASGLGRNPISALRYKL